MWLHTHTIRIWLLAISVCLLSPIALASPEFSKQLEQADSLRSSDPKQFSDLIIQLDTDTRNATPDQLEKLRYLQAYRLAFTGQYNLAIQKASVIFEQSKNTTLKYRAGLLMTNSYAVTRDYGAGFSTLNKTLLLQNKIDDPQHRHDGLFVAALLHNQVGQYALGKHYAEQILADSPDTRLRCLANSVLLEAMYNLKSMPENDTDIDHMIRSCSDHGESLIGNLSRTYLVRKWASQGNTEKAIALLEQHLTETDSSQFPRLLAEIHSLLAEYKLTVGNIIEAEHHASIAIKQSAAVPYSQPLVVAEKTLYEIALRRKDNAAALEHYLKYAEADKAYLNDVKARELAYQLVKHETLQKNQTIALLNNKNKLLQLEQTVAKQKARYTVSVIILLGVLLTLLMYWTYRTKRIQMAFRRLAETDTLTGISNRDHFNKNVEHALADAGKKTEQLSLIMFDLDNFKSINDRYGHATGDWVLKQVTQVIKPICRKQDCIGRIGGEEFAILLRASDLESATAMAERFREHIAAINTDETGNRFTATASFGVATTLSSGYNFDTLLSQADEALYQSKREGRNRVSPYNSLKSASNNSPTAAIGFKS
jgi:diguanylate cyclase